MGTTLEETLRYALDYSGYYGENILSWSQHKQRLVIEEHL